MIPGPLNTYKSTDKVKNKEENGLRLPIEMLNKINAVSDLLITILSKNWDT